MAITMAHLKSLLREVGIERSDERSGEIVFGINTEVYRNPTGNLAVVLSARLDEDGKYFRLFAPFAFRAEPAHRDAFLLACVVIQWRTKLIQFEFDETDGEVRPVIEFPIEDGTLTARQLGRCIGGMLQLLDEFAPVLVHVNASGTIEWSRVNSAGSPRAAGGAAADMDGMRQTIEDLQRQLDTLRGAAAPRSV